MSRVRPGPVTKSRHKKILKAAKGYYGARSRTFKTAAQAVYNDLTSDKAYDDESLTPKPGIPFPNPAGVKEPHEAMSQETVVPDYEADNLTSFNNNKKICEALDDNLERTFIEPINHKKGEIVTIMTAAEAAIADVNPLANTRLIIAGATYPPIITARVLLETAPLLYIAALTSPKSVAFAVVEIVIKSITLVDEGFNPAKNKLRVGEDAAVSILLVLVKLPKSAAFVPVDAIVT